MCRYSYRGTGGDGGGGQGGAPSSVAGTANTGGGGGGGSHPGNPPAWCSRRKWYSNDKIQISIGIKL
jgi:hypothetical protein